MDTKSDEWRHIPKKPRLGLDRPNYNWRHICVGLLALALLLLVMSLVLPR